MKLAFFSLLSFYLFISTNIFFEIVPLTSAKTNFQNYIIDNISQGKSTNENVPLYEVTNESMYENEKFGFKNEIYFVNKSSNS